MTQQHDFFRDDGAHAAPTGALAILALPLSAAALWYVKPALGPWPLLLLGLAVGVRRAIGVMPRLRWVDGGLALFGASALLGAYLSYDQAAAWAKFWTMVGGLGLYVGAAWTPARIRFGRWQLDPLRLLLAFLPAALAIYFLLTNDWGRWAGKLPWLEPLTAWLASWQPQLPGHLLHPNVAGGLLAAFIPMQMAAVGRLRAGWLLVAVALSALLLTESRGAWGALIVALAAWAWWTWPADRSRPLAAWRLGMAALLLLAAVAAALAWTPLGASLAAAAAERLSLLHNSLDLALDTPFTGSGLASFQMAFSSYVLLLHVGHTIHSHNLLLNIWIEQGLPGLLIFLGLLGLAVRPASSSRKRLVQAALAALIVIVVHGLVDDAFYGSRGVLLLFAPFALLTRADAESQPARAERRRLALRRAGIISAAALFLALLPQTRAAFQANLGALSQTQAELSVYRWPAWPIQDALRRAMPGATSQPPVNLTAALARYRRALTLDPHNVTANRRLGQIELSLGNYDAARDHLEAAYAAAPAQRATRQLLAESYAIEGDVARARAILQTIDVSQGQVAARVWWHQHLGESEQAQWMEEAGR